MMLKSQIALTLLVLAGILGSTIMPAQAQAGLPGDPNFGYGACLQLDGYHVADSVRLADAFGLNWLTIDFDWARYWPEASSEPRWDALDTAMQAAAGTHLATMIAITHAPPWALIENGPDPTLTADLTLRLVQRYPNSLAALELFPGANTIEGWGATPNAAAYAALLEETTSALAKGGYNQTPIAAGITPQSAGNAALDFLTALYAAREGRGIPVISLRLPRITAAPDVAPEDSATATLRFHEQARQIMRENDDWSGLIWLTRFDWDPNASLSPNTHGLWLQEAFVGLRPQLYIGMASYGCLNDPTSPYSLVDPDGRPTTAFEALARLIASTATSQISTIVIEGN